MPWGQKNLKPELARHIVTIRVTTFIYLHTYILKGVGLAKLELPSNSRFSLQVCNTDICVGQDELADFLHLRNTLQLRKIAVINWIRPENLKIDGCRNTMGACSAVHWNIVIDQPWPGLELRTVSRLVSIYPYTLCCGNMLALNIPPPNPLGI